MTEELHLHLTMDELLYNDPALTYLATYELFNLPEIYPVVHTNQTHFLSWRYAKRLFVHCYGKSHEITVGKCEGTDREIRESHDIERMLLNGEFSWFK